MYLARPLPRESVATPAWRPALHPPPHPWPPAVACSDMHRSSMHCTARGPSSTRSASGAPCRRVHLGAHALRQRQARARQPALRHLRPPAQHEASMSRRNRSLAAGACMHAWLTPRDQPGQQVSHALGVARRDVAHAGLGEAQHVRQLLAPARLRGIQRANECLKFALQGGRCRRACRGKL